MKDPKTKAAALVYVGESKSLAEVAERAEQAKQATDQVRAGAVMVLAYFASRMGKTKRFLIDEDRIKKVVARLKENHNDVSELFWVVDGATKDDWIMGRDPKARKGGWKRIETVFRNREQVERFLELEDAPESPEMHPVLKRMLEEAGWTPS